MWWKPNAAKVIREIESVENSHARRRNLLPRDDVRRIATSAAAMADVIGKEGMFGIAFGEGDGMA